MSGERDPRAWMVDEDPFDKRNNAGSHSAARDDGAWRNTKVHVVQVQPGGPTHSRIFGENRVVEAIPLHKGSIWHFSKTEIQHLLLATSAFTIALALMFSNGIWNISTDFPLLCLLSLISLAPAFLLHEFAHKFVAKYYGCWAEFRADPAGLRFGLIFAAITGFVFMAPGAVMVAGNTTRSQFGKIAVAGPITNLSLWSIGFVFWHTLNGIVDVLDQLVAYWLWGNAILAAINMLPFGPLDGKKIKSWSEPIFYTCLSVAIYFVYITYTGISPL